MANEKQNQEWDSLGRSIEEIIDKAINSQNYQELSRNITRTIDRATRTGSDALWRALDMSGATKPKETITVEPVRAEPVPKNNLPALYGSSNGETTKGILKTVFGGISTITGFTFTLISGIFHLVGIATGASLTSIPFALGLGALVGGGTLLSSGIRSLGRVSRYKVYLKALGKNTHIALEKLSRSVGKPVKFVRKELQGMINQGLFLEGHLDHEEQNLITSDETYAHYEQSRLQMEARKQAEAAAPQQPSSTPDPKVQEVLDRGNAYLREIRRCNDEIPGEEISAKISRMEAIVQRIFERAKAHPEIIPDLKKLMDYYLPMTIKLLNAYADMDRQPIQGDTIRASKQEIDTTLDTLNLAFEKLLDSVFQDTAMDVSSDISVLHTLLAQEGLTGNDFSNTKQVE
uniref:5-bromo-4-chloroindolyl phosphate hydrolysis family protein n=1 Tax=Faecousia sp. TaxID=2952921 RepID=UPI00402A28C0